MRYIVHVTADRYHAKQPGLTLQNNHAVICVSCTQVYTGCLHLEQVFETVLEEMKLDTDIL